jgi:transcriptional regulator with XRE-family HTH domain
VWLNERGIKVQKTDSKKEIGRCNIALGKVVRERRTMLGMSQEELALKADLHRTYISDLERGMRNLTIGALVGVAYGLQLPLNRIVELMEEKLK